MGGREKRRERKGGMDKGQRKGGKGGGRCRAGPSRTCSSVSVTISLGGREG